MLALLLGHVVERIVLILLSVGVRRVLHGWHRRPIVVFLFLVFLIQDYLRIVAVMPLEAVVAVGVVEPRSVSELVFEQEVLPIQSFHLWTVEAHLEDLASIVEAAVGLVFVVGVDDLAEQLLLFKH